APISFHCAKSYKSVLNRWVRPRWESYRLRDFDKPAVRSGIEEWLRSLWRSPKNVNGLAPKTVRSIWNVMKLAFKFAVKWGYLNQNPMGEKRFELPRQWHSVAIYRGPGDWVFASPYTKGKRPFWPAQLLKTHIKPVALAAG